MLPRAIHHRLVVAPAQSTSSLWQALRRRRDGAGGTSVATTAEGEMYGG